jgi:hypothetical protein
MPKDNSIGYVILEGIDVEPNLKILDQNKKTGKVVGFATFQEAERENRNGRSYLASDLLREITCPRTKELLKTNTLYSEWCHPQGDMIRQQTIDPKCCVARILSLEMNGNLVQGTFTPINTPLGLGFNAEILEGVLPAWSLRALGCLDVIKGRNVVTNLKMVTYDSVVFPSHDVAYTERIVSESSMLTESGHMNKSLIKKNKSSFNEHGELIPIMDQKIVSYIKTESANVKTILEQIDIKHESVSLAEDKNHVRMVAGNGDIFMVNLESYIQDEIGKYVAGM